MAVKKRFLLRVDQAVYDAFEKWAADELRSVNGQMEFVLAEALKKAGRYRKPAGSPPPASDEAGQAPDDEGDPD